VFPGNQLDGTTLTAILDAIEQQYGKARRLWVLDRGIVSEENLAWLRARGAHYLVGTPKRKLKACEQKMIAGSWSQASAEVDVQLVPESDEVYVLCRSAGRRQKECAMRRRWLESVRHENGAIVWTWDRKRPKPCYYPRSAGNFPRGRPRESGRLNWTRPGRQTDLCGRLLGVLTQKLL